MGLGFRAVALFSLVCCSVFAGYKPGRYVGYAAFENSLVKYPIYLEMENLRGKDNASNRVVAFFKIKLGGFRTHEYVTYHYILQGYDYSSNRISFDASKWGVGADISFWDGLFEEKGQVLTGRIRIMHGGQTRGVAKLIHYERYEEDPAELENIFPERKIIAAALTGEYKGTCGMTSKHSVLLQLEAMRVKEPYHDRANPFPGMQIVGRFGTSSPRSRFGRSGGERRIPHSGFYQKASFKKATFNPFDRTLLLPVSALKGCRFVGNELRCQNNCRLKKIDSKLTKLLVGPKCEKFPRNRWLKGVWEADNLELEDYDDENVVGAYFGNLHLSHRNKYKNIMIEVALAGDPKKGDEIGLSHPELSITTKTFSRHRSFLSAIPARYSPTEFPKEGFKPIFVFGKGGEGDFHLKIKQWNKLGMTGKMFSKSFGYLGSFEAKRSQMKKGMHTLEEKVVQGLAGRWAGTHRNSSHEFELDLVPAVGGGASKYFPFTFQGAGFSYLGMRFKVGMGVFGGAFDPFVGVARFDFGGNETYTGKYFGNHFTGFWSVSSNPDADMWRQHTLTSFSRRASSKMKPDIPELKGKGLPSIGR